MISQLASIAVRSRSSRLRLVLFGVVALLVITTSAIVAGSPPNQGPFTGCLAAKARHSAEVGKGEIYNTAASATTPSAPCRKGDKLVSFSNGRGPQGEQGLPGPAGPSDGFASVRRDINIGLTPAIVATLIVPTGDYIVNGSVFVNNTSQTDTAVIICSFRFDGPGGPIYGLGGFYAVNLAAPPGPNGDLSGMSGTLGMAEAFHLSSAGPIDLICNNNNGNPGASANINTAAMTAIKVGTLTTQ